MYTRWFHIEIHGCHSVDEIFEIREEIRGFAAASVEFGPPVHLTVEVNTSGVKEDAGAFSHGVEATRIFEQLKQTLEEWDVSLELGAEPPYGWMRQ